MSGQKKPLDEEGARAARWSCMSIPKPEDSWWPERLYLIVGSLMLAVLAAIIAAYDGRTMPQMKFGITLNTIISILATLIPAILCVPISEAFGQLKWNRYNHSTGRSLRDIEIYDSASRGALGSFLLLFKPRHRDGLAVFGAGVTLLALAFGPFAQQVVTYPQRSMPVDGHTAWIARAQSYTGHGSQGESYDYLDVAMIQAIYNGLLASSGGMAVMPDYGCPTGNCTFPAFTSLAVCSVCANVTSQTTNFTWTPAAVEGQPFPHVNYTFPSGAVADVSTEYQYPTINFTDPTTSDYTSWNTTYGPALGNLYNVILAFSALRITSENHSTTDPFEAVECALQLCVQTYENVTITSGKLISGNIQSWYTTSSTPFVSNGFDPYVLIPPPSNPNSSSSSSSAGSATNATFSIDVPTVQLFARYIEDFMSLSCQPTITPSLGQGGGANGCVPGLLFQILAANPGLSWPFLMESLATSMTNAIRNKGEEGQRGKGVVCADKVFVRVQWAWFGLPVVVVLGAVGFVVAATATSTTSTAALSKMGRRGREVEGEEKKRLGEGKRPPVWKTAALPVMFYGLRVEREDDDAVMADGKSSKVQHLAKKLRARLVEDGNGCARLALVQKRKDDEHANDGTEQC